MLRLHLIQRGVFVLMYFHRRHARQHGEIASEENGIVAISTKTVQVAGGMNGQCF